MLRLLESMTSSPSARELTTMTPMPISCKLSSNLSRYCEMYIYYLYLLGISLFALESGPHPKKSYLRLGTQCMPSIIYAWLTKITQPYRTQSNRTQPEPYPNFSELWRWLSAHFRSVLTAQRALNRNTRYLIVAVAQPILLCLSRFVLR